MNERNIIKAGINITPCCFHIFQDYKSVYDFYCSRRMLCADFRGHFYGINLYAALREVSDFPSNEYATYVILLKCVNF